MDDDENEKFKFRFKLFWLVDFCGVFRVFLKVVSVVVILGIGCFFGLEGFSVEIGVFIVNGVSVVLSNSWECKIVLVVVGFVVGIFLGLFWCFFF